MTSTEGLISQETIDAIDRMHELDAIRDKLEDAITYQQPVALTHEEAQILLSNLMVNLYD